MKRRNFLGSLFAAGAVIKEPVLACDGAGQGQSVVNPEVITPLGKFPLIGDSDPVRSAILRHIAVGIDARLMIQALEFTKKKP